MGNSYQIGFMGCGNMAKAILAGILEQGIIADNQIMIYDVNSDQTNKIKEKTNIEIAKSAQELCNSCEMIILAIKPNIIPMVLAEIGDSLKNKALLSIAAGITSEQLKNYTNQHCRVLRVMPNTPAMVGAGASVLCDNTTTFTKKEQEIAFSIFSALGIAFWLHEEQIDAVIGVSGSGPAYAYMFIEAMADGGVQAGLSRDIAQALAAQTLLGSAKMVLESGQHPGALKDMVCSPGGTTIDAVLALEQNGFRGAVMDAVITASDKSKSMEQQ